MTVGTMDIFLLVVIVSALIVGFFWGAARSLMLVAGWLVAFLAGAYLKPELGAYLSQQWDNFPATFSVMAAFGLIYGLVLVASLVIIVVISRGNQDITRFQVIDDFVGAGVAVLVAVLGIAGLLIVLATFYGTGESIISPSGGPAWTANLYQTLLDSTIGSSINDLMVPIIGTLLGPILPSDVREVFG